MFRCGICNTPVTRGRVAHVCTESRPRHYPYRPKANEHRNPADGKKFYTDDPGGDGWEIAREVLSCESCAIQHLVSTAAPSVP